MNIEILIILSLVGIAAGILSGIFGIGGGVIIVPALLTVYSLSGNNSPYVVHISIATSLFTVIFTGISSSISHSKNGNVIWSAAFWLGLSGSLSVFLFSIIAVNTPGGILKKIFGIIMLLVAVKMFIEKEKIDEKEYSAEIPLNKLIFVITGFFAGIISSFTGLGGGIFIIPLLHYLLKFPFKKAVGTSSAAIIITALSGTISYNLNIPSDFIPDKFYWGVTDVIYALPVIIFSVSFTHLGSIINKKTDHVILSRSFAVLLLIISIKIILF